MTIGENDLFCILGAQRCPAVAIREGLIIYANALAGEAFHPHLPGKRAELFFPPELLAPVPTPANTSVQVGGAEYSVTLLDAEDVRALIFLPDLADRQLLRSLTDGAVQTLRQELAVLDSNLSLILEKGRAGADLSILNAAARMLRTVHSLSRASDNYSRLLNDVELTPDPVPVELVRVVGELVLSVNSVLGPDQPRIGLVYSQNAIPCLCDLHLLDIALLNLLSNSLKFTPPEGTIAVELRQTSSNVLIAVTDSGRGVPPGELNDIFRAYLRPRDVQSAGSGLGMGLGVVRRIMAAHNGRAIMTSRPGSGVTVTLSFPAPELPTDAKLRRWADRSGAFILTELADVLPSASFLTREYM